MPVWNESVYTAGNGHRKGDIAVDRATWFYDFARNCLGYGTILVPGFMCIRYYQRKRESFDLSRSSSFYNKVVQLFVFGWKPAEIGDKSPDFQPHYQLTERIRSSKCGKHYLFAFCFIGLLFSHLIWGFYQEKMMTRDYYYRNTGDAASTSSASFAPERFRDSQFIVFLNRVSALLLSLGYICIRQWRRRSSSSFVHASPFYKYSYASLSNILSSWCQYEALKYVSFPTQVLGKASKIIPTMIVGRLVRKQHYAWHQYLIGAIISIGVSLFLLSRAEVEPGKRQAIFSNATTISGIILIIGYLIFDSFTSNWQSSLFQEYRVSEMQMMCGVNFFSTLFTLVPLLEQGSLLNSILFMRRHPDFSFDCLTTSCCSAIGQLFIFFTISEFGPVALAVIMTIRQAFAILLSCLYYGHRVSELGILGLCVVFLALLIGQYLNKVCGSVARRHGTRS